MGRVRLVRGEGRGVSTWYEGGGGHRPVAKMRLCGYIPIASCETAPRSSAASGVSAPASAVRAAHTRRNDACSAGGREIRLTATIGEKKRG